MKRRNEQWSQLEAKFVKKEEIDILGNLACIPKKQNKVGKLENLGKMDHFDSVIWLGDCNYRISASSPDVIEMLMKEDMWEVLDSNDQMNIETKIKRICVGF